MPVPASKWDSVFPFVHIPCVTGHGAAGLANTNDSDLEDSFSIIHFRIHSLKIDTQGNIVTFCLVCLTKRRLQNRYFREQGAEGSNET